MFMLTCADDTDMTSYRYMRSIATFECDWSTYNAVIAKVSAIADPAQKKAAAVAQGIPARISLMTNFTAVIQNLLTTVSNIEGSGTLYDVISHSAWDAVGPPATTQLAMLTGAALPAEAMPPPGWSTLRAPLARVQVIRTMLAAGEPLRIRAIVLAPLSAPPKAVTLFSAAHGAGADADADWASTPLVQAASEGGVERFVYTVTLPPQKGDFQWYLKVELPAPTAPYTEGLGIPAGTVVGADGVTCFVPPAGPAQPQSVVIMPE